MAVRLVNLFTMHHLYLANSLVFSGGGDGKANLRIACPLPRHTESSRERKDPVASATCSRFARITLSPWLQTAGGREGQVTPVKCVNGRRSKRLVGGWVSG